jgi:formylglycine-generating enzyme required for sulfatase activity/tetratricopeptide (TPR) repeat protein
MSSSYSEAYFVDGGTLRANTPSYVTRPADDELFEALLNREYCYVLTPRQMGKSSLMIRTSQHLKEQNIQSAIVDIQGIGTNKIREWYASLLSRIRRGLRLNVDVDEWMSKKSNVGFGQMFSDFIQDIVLAEIPDPVVIFLDEVDWMIKIDFRDDFFASIRSMYNARAEYPEFSRVSFVLLGVASPADLISEPTRTPFNIGHSIPLQELSLEDATPLQAGLEQVCPGEGTRILDRVFYWTNGHPYLTQKICKTIAEAGKAAWSDSDVDDLVHRLFLAEESRKEANLKFIQDRILSNEHFAQMLKLYQRVRRSKIKENGQSITQNQLMLSGLLTSHNGYLVIRNRIYQTVFNERWINRNMPKNWQRVALVAVSSLMVLLLGVLGYNYTVGLRLKTLQSDYINHNPAQKITDLARIYRLRYLLLANTDIDAAAAQTFYDFTPSSKEQLSLFPIYGFHEPAKQNDLVTVIKKLYVTLANVDEENDNTGLLQAMDNALHKSDMNTGIGNNLKQELDGWISGRIAYNNKDYVAALNGYNDAYTINPSNQATLYERAKVYVALKQYDKALKDLDAAIAAARQSAPDIPPSPTPTNSPIPPSNTPAPSVTNTPKPNATNQISNTQSVGNGNTPTIEAVTPTLGITLTSVPLTPNPTAAPVQPVITTPDKFESNFTTLNHVIVAVKALVDENPKLQAALLSSTNSYSNLDFLVTAYAQRPPAKPSPAIPVLGNLGGADKIAFVANKDIWLMNVDGSNPQQVTNDGASKSDLQWLPDGKTLIFISGKRVKYIDVDTGTIGNLASFPSEASLDAFQVSHNEKQVMIVISNEIFVVPFDFETMKNITGRDQLSNLKGSCMLPTPGTLSALAVKKARWSAADQLVSWLYNGIDASSVLTDQIDVLDITACQPQSIVVKDNFPGMRFTPVDYDKFPILPSYDWDGNDLFVFNTFKRNSGWGELYVYNWQTHNPTLIKPVEGKCCYRDGRFSPDGTYLFFEFQDETSGANPPTVLYYIPVGELNTGANFVSIPLPDGFFKNPRENAQAALRSSQANQPLTSTLQAITTLSTKVNFPPGSTVQYGAVDGDWLVQIARCFGADLSATQNANPQINDANASLLPGTIVTIPNIGSNGKIYGPPCVTYYTAQTGDTWESIAQKYNADLAVLKQKNSGVSFSSGARLLIPLNSAGGNLSPTSTPALGIDSTVISKKDGMTLLYVPAGNFTMGVKAEEALAECLKYRSDCFLDTFKDEEPQHEVYLDAFWIDKTEVTNKMYALCVDAGMCKGPANKGSDTHSSYYGNTEFDNYPVIYVDWNMAKNYCEWVGRRLPTEADWEKAARGSDGNIYPWGNQFNGALANFCDTNCPLPWPNTSFNDGFGDVSPVGKYPGGAGPYGVLDMVGNVWEWVADWYSANYYATLGENVHNPQGPVSGQYRILRGGSWDNGYNGVTTTGRKAIDASSPSKSVGFRCAMSATP